MKYDPVDYSLEDRVSDIQQGLMTESKVIRSRFFILIVLNILILLKLEGCI